MDRDLLAGMLSPDGSLPGSRIAPNPILLTVRSPSSHAPAAAALITGDSTPPGYASSRDPQRLGGNPGSCYRGRVSRVHDMGGQTGFGPVPVADDGTVAFHADWEARVYALAAVCGSTACSTATSCATRSSGCRRRSTSGPRTTSAGSAR